MTSSKPMKKLRLDDDDDNDNDDGGGKSIVTNSFECRAVPKPIVADEFIVDVPLHEAYIGILRNKCDTAVAIKNIMTILPGFSHLKRCSNGKLLLAFVNNKPMDKYNNDSNLSFSSENDLKKYLNENNFNLQLLEETFLIMSVPARSSRTKSQAKKSSIIWPVNFHPDNSIELLLNGTFFNTSQLNIIDTCMKLCIDASKHEAVGNEHCNGSAVILDPNDNGKCRIIAIASCRINEHPMWHAAMLAVDLVAKFRGGGAWKLNSSSNSQLNTNTNECNKRKFPLNPPICYPLSLNNLNIPEFTDNAIGNININHESSPDNENNCSYLCTNYWIFLIQEPCPMCSMALLHSRIAMIFYGVSNKSRGILGSNAMLHTMPGLNHRYKVWSDVLHNDCQRTAMEIGQRDGINII